MAANHRLTVNCNSAMAPAEPLWKRVPTSGDDGRPLSDFMMLIPGLKTKQSGELADAADRLQGIFDRYEHAVVFADLNPRLNILWVSVRPVPGIVLELATAIHAVIPEAKLVAHKFQR